MAETKKSHTIWYILGGGIVLYLLFGKSLFAGPSGPGGAVTTINQKVSGFGIDIYSRNTNVSTLTGTPLLFVATTIQIPFINATITINWYCSKSGNIITNSIGVSGSYQGNSIGDSPVITYDYTTLASGAYTHNFLLGLLKFTATKVS